MVSQSSNAGPSWRGHPLIRAAFGRSRLNVEAGGRHVPVARIRDDGFSVEAAKAAHLRGCVNLYSGRQPIAQCLVVYSGQDGDLVHYELKSWTGIEGGPALDYVAGEEAPGEEG